MKFRRTITHLIFSAIAIAGLLAQPGTTLTAHAQGSIEQRLVARARQITGDNFPVYVRTERGANVFARTRPRVEVLRAIDAGLTELFDIARRHGYRNRLEHSYYTVFIARADRVKDSSGAYSPDIAVAAGQYAGSGYDQGGYVYAAGMVMAYNPASFIIAEHERDFSRISNVVRYEGEHLVLYHNDRALHARTADHSRGGGHPILQ
ncbi:MAG TPA: hypothetical protein VJT09_16850 [Pyrinomonadaceae bacterium]|nr:hypothetical protein [Pyrinomonadaceae bacterium]